MHLFDKLPFLRNSKNPEAEAISEADIKADRIKFHRAKVRTGPVKFKTQTAGQFKREQKRALARKTKRARRAQLNRYFAERQESSTLRGNLQAVGLLPYYHENTKALPQAALRSTIWILEAFAQAPKGSQTVTLTEDVVREALLAALNRYQTLTGQVITKLPEGYELPVQVAA